VGINRLKTAQRLQCWVCLRANPDTKKAGMPALDPSGFSEHNENPLLLPELQIK
jgi:hypothetical protein